MSSACSDLALRTSLGLEPQIFILRMNLDGTSCVPALWATRVETPTHGDVSIGSGRLCVVGRFESAEDAADWCLNNPCLITMSRNSRPDKPFKGRPRGERDLGRTCENGTCQKSTFATRGLPAKQTRSRHSWGLPTINNNFCLSLSQCLLQTLQTSPL